MRNLLVVIFAVVVALAGPAYAWTCYLVAESENDSGDTLCHYDNGTVLNVGIRLCPLSIEC